MASDSGPLERNRRTEQWRTARIKRFEEQQRKLRKWINFAEIAECYTREDQSILPIDLLARDLLAGEFEENDSSLVLFLHPTLPPKRMTREWCEQLKGVIDYDWGRPYLEHCWIPQRLFERWRERNRLPSSPCFEPLDEQSPGRLKQRPRKKRRKPGLERAQAALKVLYPDGVPDQATLPNATLCQQVSDKLKNSRPPLPSVSNDTILRAAGRRK